MTPRFPKVMRFGLGFGPVPVRWRRRMRVRGQMVVPAPVRRPGEAYIDMDSSEPLWTQVATFGHEVLHTAIEFYDWCMDRAKELEQEAQDTHKELHGDD